VAQWRCMARGSCVRACGAYMVHRAQEEAASASTGCRRRFCRCVRARTSYYIRGSHPPPTFFTTGALKTYSPPDPAPAPQTSHVSRLSSSLVSYSHVVVVVVVTQAFIARDDGPARRHCSCTFILYIII